LISVALPVATGDAQRTEMLGATLGALLVSTLKGEYASFEGDSSYVCGLLDGTYVPRETFFYNCLELCRDFLCGKNWKAQWISREYNSVCDSLARQAV
jgi:ribonuclease HI